MYDLVMLTTSDYTRLHTICDFCARLNNMHDFPHDFVVLTTRKFERHLYVHDLVILTTRNEHTFAPCATSESSRLHNMCDLLLPTTRIKLTTLPYCDSTICTTPSYIRLPTICDFVMCTSPWHVRLQTVHDLTMCTTI